MSLLFTLLFHLLPTLGAWYLIAPRIPYRSPLLRAVSAWFLGQVAATSCIYGIACLGSLFVYGVLFKAAILFLLLLVPFIAWARKSNPPLIPAHTTNWLQLAAVPLCILVSAALYTAQLAYKNENILRSVAYWDIGYQALLIQSFAAGDNFPAGSYSFAGAPLAYHFGPFLHMAIHAAFGLSLPAAINLSCILVFAGVLLAIIGIAEELFSSTGGGVAAVILTLTGSALRVDLLDALRRFGVILFTKVIASYHSNPPRLAFVKGNHFGYNGMMTDLFYFVAERQLVYAILYLIIGLGLIWHRKSFSPLFSIGTGILLAVFFQWHLFVTLLLAIVLGICALRDYREWRKSFWFAVPFGAVFIVNLIHSTVIMHSPWYQTEFLSGFPKINFEFSTMPRDYPVSPWNMVQYWVYVYGAKLVILFLAISTLGRRMKDSTRILLFLIVPAFVLINTVQLSPISVYDNHKWLRPMNIFIDLLCGVYLVHLLGISSFWRRGAAFCSFLPLTFSGLCENLPYFLSKPEIFYARYPSHYSTALQKHSKPDDVFLADVSKPILLAGRKMALRLDGESNPPMIAADEFIRFNARADLITKIYASRTLEEFCSAAIEAGVTFFQYSPTMQPALRGVLYASFSPLRLITEDGRMAVFLNIPLGCGLNGHVR